MGGQRSTEQPSGSGVLWVGFWGRTGSHSVQLLFSCRNLNDDIIPQVGALEVTANIVFGYATWVPSHHPLAHAVGLSLPAWLRAGQGLRPPCLHPSILDAGGVGRAAAPSPSQGREVPMALLSFGQHLLA